MTTVLLGNVAALTPDGEAADVGNTITEVIMRDGFDDPDEARLALSTDNDRALTVIRAALAKRDERYALGVLEVNDLWSTAHSDDPPEWVESDDADFARVLAAWFGDDSHGRVRTTDLDLLDVLSDPPTSLALRCWVKSRGHVCAVGRPDGWASAVDRPPLGGGAQETEWGHFSEDVLSRLRVRELLTNAGRDDLHAQHIGTGAQPAAYSTLSLSASAVAESAANTTLPGRITTAGGGLVPAAATYAHTLGTNTSTLTKTFTANATDVLPVTVAKVGVENGANRLGYERLLASTATLSASGDNVAITWTLTGG